MYGTDEELISYNAARGRTSMDELDADTRNQLRLLASSTLDAMFESRFIGARTSHEQPNGWPRTGAALRRFGIAATVIPTMVEWAAYELAHVMHSEPDAFQAVFAVGSLIKRETVGPMTTEYALPVEGADLSPRIPLIEGMLTPLLRDQNYLKGVPTFLVI